MTYAQMRGDVVANIIAGAEGLTTWGDYPLIPLSDEPGAHGVAVQPGDILVDSGRRIFARPEEEDHGAL